MRAATHTTDVLLTLLDRDRELAELTAALNTAGRGEGVNVLIAGAAGTGKSTLLAVGVEHARERGFAIGRARGSELEQELSFGAIRQLFESLLRSAGPAERDRLLSGAAKPAKRLFADAPVGPSAGADGGFATLHAIYWLAATVAIDCPLLLAVDDVHWLDASSLRALSYLAGRLSDVPIALFLALRPHEPTGDVDLVFGFDSQPATRCIELRALPPTAVTEIVRAEIPGAGDELCLAFHESSAGNPFYLRELLRSVDSRGGIPPTPDQVRAVAVASVSDRVLRRVGALGADAPRLAAAMSVLGAGQLREAAAVAGQDEEAAARTARGMRRIEILGSDNPFEWIHPLVRRSIYDSLTVAERDLLHRRAARILRAASTPAGAVAAHLSALQPSGSAEVAAGLLTAAEEALSRDAPDVAVALLRRALDERADEPPRAKLLLRLGEIETTRRDPIAAEILREVLATSTDPRDRALAAMSLGESLTHSGQWDASVEVMAAGIQDYDGTDPILALELEMHYAVGCAFDPALAPSFWAKRERLLSLSHGESWAARALSALFALLYAWRGDPLGEVVTLSEHATADGVLISDRGAGAWTPTHVLGALAAIDDWERAHSFLDELEFAARNQGSVANAITAEAYRGLSCLRRGDLTAGEEILRPVIAAAQANGMPLALITGLWWLGGVILERPSQADLVDAAESLTGLPPAFMEAAGGAWLLLARGRARMQRGALGAAEADLRKAGQILDQLGWGPLHDSWRPALAQIVQAADPDEARQLIDEELIQADATGLARPRGTALRASALIIGGDEGTERLRESVTLLARSPARYEHARSLVELGAALRRSGHRRDARESLEAGLELAHLCGAERTVVRARDELLATGARPRHIVRSGFDSLTASERRIVRLAAEGRSNPEIAQTLFVSLKTVETHLSNAYRKLDLSGPGARRRLAEAIP